MALHYDTYGVKDDDAYSSFSDDDSKHAATVYRGDDEFEVESSNDQDLTARVFRKIILDRSDTLDFTIVWNGTFWIEYRDAHGQTRVESWIT